MTPEEWKAHVQQWQQRGGVESNKAPDPSAPASTDNNDADSWLGTAESFGKGMLREGASQIGVAKDFAQGGDPNSTAEWLGRQATDIAPSVALDIAAPEIGVIPTAMRGAKYIRPLIDSAIKGGIGGAMANPQDRRQGGNIGAETGVGSAVVGGVLHNPAVRSTLLPLVLLAEMAERSGVIPHEVLPLAYPWAMAHGISALGGLARSAGIRAPATTGAIGSRVQQETNQSQ